MQTLDSTGRAGKGIKQSPKPFRTILKTPHTEPQTPSETQHPASEAVPFIWLIWRASMALWSLRSEPETKRLGQPAGREYPERRLRPTNRAGNIQDEGSCSGQPPSPCKADGSSCKDPTHCFSAGGKPGHPSNIHNSGHPGKVRPASLCCPSTLSPCGQAQEKTTTADRQPPVSAL